MHDWLYEIGNVADPSQEGHCEYRDVTTTRSKAEAFAALRENGRNYMVRYRYGHTLRGKILVEQRYDPRTRTWKRVSL